jgi:very-short-patch-repair endonuclease
MTEFFNKSKYKQTRKDLRNNPTKTEKLIWDLLKGKKLEGCKFIRQYGVGRYVIDFYCVKKKLAIELDGEVHVEDV